jgi:hypothetical protein
MSKKAAGSPSKVCVQEFGPFAIIPRIAQRETSSRDLVHESSEVEIADLKEVVH